MTFIAKLNIFKDSIHIVNKKIDKVDFKSKFILKIVFLSFIITIFSIHGSFPYHNITSIRNDILK